MKVVWITMLALANPRGQVMASIPGLANVSGVTLDQCQDAISKLLSPDPYSRTKDHEGRRIREVDGGWELINYLKYRELRDREERRIQNALNQQKHRNREKKKVITPADSQPLSATVSQSKPKTEDRRQKEKTDPDQTLQGGALTRALVACFCDKWRAKYGSAYIVQKRDAGAAGKLTMGPEAWEGMVERYLADTTPFHVGRRHPLEHLANNPNEFTGPKAIPPIMVKQNASVPYAVRQEKERSSRHIETRAKGAFGGSDDHR